MNIFERLKKDETTRNKLLKTIGILFLILIGYEIPIMGINTLYATALSNSINQSGFGGLFGMMTGSAFSQMSIFALSITPFITSSIILQLFSAFVPPLEKIIRDGNIGKQKMERLTLALSFIIALAESLMLSLKLGKAGLFVNYNIWMVLYSTITWTLGACFLVFVGQKITKKLIGNGISLILLLNILSTLPKEISVVFKYISLNCEVIDKILIGFVFTIVSFSVFGYVVLLNGAEKRIQISNSNRLGVFMNGTMDSFLPIKLNSGGVMPVIFTSSIMSVPFLLAKVINNDSSILSNIANYCNQTNWFNLNNFSYTIGVLIFIPLMFAFSYFYAAISFNPKSIAENMKKSGMTINGIRPGLSTEKYLKKQLNNTLIGGTSMLIIIALLPSVIAGILNIPSLGFGGTTIIIIVGVLLELKNAIIAQTSTVTFKSLV